MGKVDGGAMSQHEDASRMLEAALQQMDGFLNGVRLENGDVAPAGRSVSEIAEELSLAISESPFLPTITNQRVALVLQNWINQNIKSGPEFEERIIKLENDKESLQLQVTVLTDQVEAQSEKITDLQGSLEDKRQQLNTTEDALQREILSRSALETQKLELMSTISELKLQLAGLERENIELREEKLRYLLNKPTKPPVPRNTSPAVLQSTYGTRISSNSYNKSNIYQDGSQTNPFVNEVSHSTPNSLNHVINLSPSPISTTQRYGVEPVRRPNDQFNSLPRQREADKENVVILRKNVAFGKPINRLITLSSEKSYSAPNLAETERVIQDELSQRSEDEKDSGLNSNSVPTKGIRKIFNKPDKPFEDWNTEDVCNWFEELGLESYVADGRRWVKSGAHLLAASQHDFEKELSMKNPLHRKKLCLALLQIGSKVLGDELLKPASLLDTAWVLRWLDDVGLPQHKEAFLTARIDGRMLHRLTMDDLATLHVTSVLHVASLRRGIQVLREYKMDGNCLTRRSAPDEGQTTAADVSLWTNHRVMEWLRAVDLAEYAPNLRGSGVHGALMVHEIKFNAELLASLLNIPASKTLLRRHLNTHFKELLGKESIQAKREAETTLGYVPLTVTAKVKVTKKTQFTLKKKKGKCELDYGDLVCPLLPGSHNTSDDEGEKSRTGCLSSH